MKYFGVYLSKISFKIFLCTDVDASQMYQLQAMSPWRSKPLLSSSHCGDES